jgi:small subunit ribosomal protein S6
MPLYEHVFLARQDASTQQVEELTTQMTGIVEQLGGKVVKMENWGVRSLTYRMSKNRKAHFVLLNIDAPSAAVTESDPLSHRSRRRARGRPLGDDAQGRSRP